MAGISFTRLVATSVVGSVLLVQFAPNYIITSSYVWTAVQLFFIHFVAWATWRVVIHPRYVSPLRHLPQPTGNKFFMGQWHQIAEKPSGVPAEEWVNSIPNDGLIRYLGILNQERLIPTNPKALGEVLTQKNYELIKPRRLRNSIGRLLGAGILVAEGDQHKAQRKALMPAFAFRHVKNLYPVFWSKSRELVEAITSHVQENSDAPDEKSSPCAVVEIGGWASRATLDIIGVAGMGRDFGALKDPESELNQAYRKVFTPNRPGQLLGLAVTVLPFSLIRRLPVQANTDIPAAAEIIKRTCRELIRSKTERLKDNASADVDILSVALSSGMFSEDDLVNQLMTFLAAGHETTAGALLWATYLLSNHAEVQTRLRDEIRANLPSVSNENSQISAADIDQLPYLHAVCNEVLRFFPPVPLTIRETAHDTTILNQFVPAGTTVIIAPQAVNRSVELWGPDAQDFRPERWLGPGRANTGGADSNYSFLTFLHGPRSCIGQTFARAEFACLLAAVVGRFEMDLADRTAELEIMGGITQKPKDGLKLRMKVVEGW